MLSVRFQRPTRVLELAPPRTAVHAWPIIFYLLADHFFRDLNPLRLTKKFSAPNMKNDVALNETRTNARI
jgi:hypothetical protein